MAENFKYGDCRKCGRLCVDLLHHRCPPTWEVRFEDKLGHGEEWSEPVYAVDGEEAAEKFAERYDCECGDYPILTGGGERFIEVRREGAEAVDRFSIYAESVPQYHARAAS